MRGACGFKAGGLYRPSALLYHVSMRLAVRACVLALLLFASLWGRARADGDPPETLSQFDCIQHTLASEGLTQPPEALLNMARALRDRGACYRDRNWLTGWGLALDARDGGYCEASFHCRAYFEFDTFAPRLREPLAQAAHIALTEWPQIPRRHFTARTVAVAYFFLSPRACPDGYWESGDIRYC